MQWQKPRHITGLTGSLVEYGCNSQEKVTQKEREKHVLLALYFDKKL